MSEPSTRNPTREAFEAIDAYYNQRINNIILDDMWTKFDVPPLVASMIITRACVSAYTQSINVIGRAAIREPEMVETFDLLIKLVDKRIREERGKWEKMKKDYANDQRT